MLDMGRVPIQERTGALCCLVKKKLVVSYTQGGG